MNKAVLRKPSVLVLIVANLIPLWGVIFRGWDVSNILHLYWAENVAVGVVSVLKILSNQHEGSVLPAKIFLAGFFSVHYGFFCFGHAMFVFGGIVSNSPDFGSPAGRALEYLTTHKLLIGGFLASHLFSFFTNYLMNGEAKRLDAGKVMFLPYRRIVILHVTIIFGGMAVVALGSPVGLVVILVIAKTFGDLFFHVKEHEGTDPGTTTAFPRQTA